MEVTLSTFGSCGRVLHVNLTSQKIEIETPAEAFYRKYLGGSAMGTYYLLKNSPPGCDPLGPDNTLSLMTGVVTAKPPISGLIGDSQSGGFWPAELKKAGFDGIVIRGKADTPSWLWIHDGKAELCDASDLWGRVTGEVEDAIRSRLNDDRVQVLQCGPAAEKGVRYGALISSTSRANGRTGMGTVMAAKNLRAVAVRGSKDIPLADPAALKELAL